MGAAWRQCRCGGGSATPAGVVRLGRKGLAERLGYGFEGELGEVFALGADDADLAGERGPDVGIGGAEEEEGGGAGGRGDVGDAAIVAEEEASALEDGGEGG